MAHIDPTLDGPTLIELLTKQRDLYGRLRELSQQQRELIRGDRPETLLAILRERQTHVAALVLLNEQLAPFRRDWDETSGRLAAPIRQKATALLGEINGMLRTILQTDQEDSALLSARKETIGREMHGVSGGQTANTAYARQGATENGGVSADLSG